MLRGWLGQVTSLGLQRNHVYRGRWLVQNPFQFAALCSSLPTGPIIQQFLNLPGTGTAFPADLQVFTTEGGLPADWPANRREFAGAGGQCVVWAQMRAVSDFLLPVGTIEQALAPVNGRLVDFWDETDDIVLVDTQVGTPAPPPVPPTVPPPTTTPPSPPSPPPPTTAPPKKKKTPAQVVVPWGIAIGVASLLFRVLRS